MDSKLQFNAALRAGRGDDDLIRIARSEQLCGSDPRKAYELVQEIWLEFGFDHRTDGGEIQDRLEYVLERLWQDCPAA